MANRKLGFTLVEILIAVSVLAVLAAVSLTVLNPPRQIRRARDTQRKSDLSQYRTGLEAYAAENDSLYPSYSTAVNLHEPVCSEALYPNFVSACPTDPEGAEPYVYRYQSSADMTEYVIWANLENGDYWWVCANGKSGESASEPGGLSDCDSL